jgi:small subunit ribosomal protein S6
LSDDQAKEAVAKFKGILKDVKAKTLHEEFWGLKKLAYPIQKKTTGFYQLVEFEADAQAIAKLEVEYRRDERVLRFLTVKLDKHAIAYNEKKRSAEGLQKPKKKEKAAQA